MPTGQPLLVLWDIDHTLIETRGVGAEVYAAAFRKVTGRPLERMASMAGRTEPVIFRDTLALHGIGDPGGMFARFAQEQASGYTGHLVDPDLRVWIASDFRNSGHIRNIVTLHNIS